MDTEVVYGPTTVLPGQSLRFVGRQRCRQVERTLIAWVEVGANNWVGGHNNSMTNLRRAYHERVMCVKSSDGSLAPCPKPKPGAWDDLRCTFSKVVQHVGSVRPLTGQQFVDQCPAHKRRLYDEAKERYEKYGWTSRDAKLKLFVKFEKLNFTLKSDPAPRLISPRSPVYNFALGRYTRAMEEHIFQACADVWDCDASVGEKVVMKGLTVEGVGDQLRRKWMKYNRPMAIGLDASRFDQHVSVEALKMEHFVYNSCMRSQELRALLRQQLKNRGIAYVDGYELRTIVDGTRASGDMNTGLGNCLLMCCMIHRYAEVHNLRCDLVNNGDDCVVICESVDLPKFDNVYNWFLELGFEMEIEPPVYEFEQVVFCQMQPVWSGDHWVMVRQPKVAMCKDVVMLGGKNFDDYASWCHSVGVGGTSLYGDMPIYSSFYKKLQQFGSGYRPRRDLLSLDSGFYRMCLRGRNHSGRVSDAARVSFYKAFNISPAHQLEIERSIDGIVCPKGAIFENDMRMFAESLGYTLP